LVKLGIDTNGKEVRSVNAVAWVFGRKGTAYGEKDLEKRKCKKSRWK